MLFSKYFYCFNFMKKLYAIVAAVAALTFTACGNKTENTAECDSTCTEKCACEPCECDPCECSDVTCCKTEGQFCAEEFNEALETTDVTLIEKKFEEAKAYIAQLIEQGKNEEAAKYTEQLQQFIAENKEKIENAGAGNVALTDLVESVVALPTNVADLATSLGVQAKDAAVGAKDAVEGAAADAVAAGQQKVEAGKAAVEQKANEAVEAGKQKANEAVETGKQKTGEAIDNAANELKRGLGL